jgi:hypothetical protein
MQRPSSAQHSRRHAAAAPVKCPALPREPSAAGIMVLGLLVAFSKAQMLSPGLVAGSAALLLLHLLCFDAGFAAARGRRLRRLAIIALLNSAPYALILWLRGAAEVFVPGLLLAIVVFALATTAYLLDPRSPDAYVAGSVIPALAGLAIVSALDSPEPSLLPLWSIFALHVVARTAYTESRLPFRDYNPWISVTVLGVAVVVAAIYKPLLLVALVEPCAMILRNAAKGPYKLQINKLKQYGRRELLAQTVFTALLIVADGIG